MSHFEIDEISMEIAHRVADRLRAQPELLVVAHENLRRWSQRNADSPSLLRCYAEWQSILNQPLEVICTMLCAETDGGQRLRQNSPFAGILSPAEIWKIKSGHHHATAGT